MQSTKVQMIEAGKLDIAYLEFGPADGIPAILLHGFPYDVSAYSVVTSMLSERGIRSFVPYLRGFGQTRFLSDSEKRSGQQAALGTDLIEFMDALDIKNAILGGYDWGGRAACIVAAVWPERVVGLVSCGAGYNIQNIARASQPAPPQEESRYWYMYYFHTERGRSGLTQRRSEFCRHLWSTWSPSWAFDDQTFSASAEAFENPDFVEVVLHSYRHRFGNIDGDSDYHELEELLARQPIISVPSIILQGEDDRVDPPDLRNKDRSLFQGPYRRRVISNTGHNLPQEAPEEFANAVSELAAAVQ